MKTEHQIDNNELRIDQRLYNDVVSSCNIISGDRFLQHNLAIAKAASDMVVQTLGPYGSTTVVDNGVGGCHPSKDGWTCLSNLKFTNPTYNALYSNLRSISYNSVTSVGDGTTSAMVTAYNFLKTLYNEIIPDLTADGTSFRQTEFITAISNISSAAREALLSNQNVCHIDRNGNFDDIYKVAYIATNGNAEFAEIVRQAYKETGNADIQLEMGSTLETKLEINQGYSFRTRVINHELYVNDKNDTIVLSNADRKAVIFDHTLSYNNHVRLLSNLAVTASNEGKQVVVFAPHFDDLVCEWLNHHIEQCTSERRIAPIMLVQIPIASSYQRSIMFDLAAMMNCSVADFGKVNAWNVRAIDYTNEHKAKTNGTEFVPTVIADSDNVTPLYPTMEDVTKLIIGTIRKLTINKSTSYLQEYTAIMDTKRMDIINAQAEKDYNEAKEIVANRANNTSDAETAYSLMRYIKLRGVSACITTGGTTEAECQFAYDTLHDAVAACRSAFNYGYVRGMNIEIIKYFKDMIDADNAKITSTTELAVDVDCMTEYERQAAKLLICAFTETAIQVFKNKDPNIDRPCEHAAFAGVEANTLTPHQVLATMIQHNCDFNIITGEFKAAGNWDVINSTATDTEILKAVVGVLSTIMTSSQFISMTHRFDQDATSDTKFEESLRDEARLYETRVNAVIEALGKHQIDVNELVETWLL